MARSATKRALRALNNGASSVAEGVRKNGTKLVAALPNRKPTKLAQIRGVVVNRKVLIPAAIVVGLGAAGYGAYRIVTSDDWIMGHFPGLQSRHYDSYADHSTGPAASVAIDEEGGDPAKPADDSFTSSED